MFFILYNYNLFSNNLFLGNWGSLKLQPSKEH